MVGPTYLERHPGGGLGAVVACTWTATAGENGARHTDRVLPDGCVDIVWDGSALVVAGPDTGPVALTSSPGASYAGIRFRPGTAPTALGVPADALLDARVPLEALWGRAGRDVADRVAAAAGPSPAVQVLVEVVADRLAGGGDGPDTVVRAAVAALAVQPDRRVDELADAMGTNPRTLHRRFCAAVGYGPRTFARVVRFRHFLASVGEAGAATPPTLATMAAECGYADQAHLSRECRRLAGSTPAALVARGHPAP